MAFITFRSKFVRLFMALCIMGSIGLVFISVFWENSAITVQTTLEELFSANRLDIGTINLIKGGTIFGVDPDQPWRKPYVTNKSIDPIPQAFPRCSAMTFFDPSDEDFETESALLETWKRAIYAAGFNPIVLTEEDCFKHPQFQDFITAGHSAQYVSSNKKFFAWAFHGAGLFMDYRVIPMMRDINPESLLSRLRTCDFDWPIRYEPFGLALVTSGELRIKRIIEILLRGLEYSQLKEFFDIEHDEDGFAYYSRQNIAKMNGRELSDDEILELINVHLHQQFIDYYQNSKIYVVNPFDGSDILNLPAISLAKKLAMCPDSSLSVSCPPLAKYISTINKGWRISCNNFCNTPLSKGKGIELEESQYLPGNDSGSLAIVGLAHPLTYLAAAEMDGSVTAEKGRNDESFRDKIIQVLVTNYIPQENVGNDYRLLLAKDSIYSSFYRSNSTWFTWETFVGDIEMYTRVLEWDLGFTFNKINPHVMEKIDFDTLNLDEGGKADLSSVLKTAKTRVLAIDPDDDVRTTSSWNPMEMEIWNFIQGWNKRLDESITKITGNGYRG